MSRKNQPVSQALFWELTAELQAENRRIVEGTIMNGRRLRLGKESLALVDYKGSGLVVKLPKDRVDELVDAGLAREPPLRWCLST